MERRFAFWTAFLRSLRARGLSDVRLVVSDAHEGLRASIERVMVGAARPDAVDECDTE